MPWAHLSGTGNRPLTLLPHSEACERNKSPIAKVLAEVVRTSDRKVLEIGAGTGQHAVHMAARFPWVTWQATDVDVEDGTLATRFRLAGLGNLLSPQSLDVGNGLGGLEAGIWNGLYSANTLHIMPGDCVPRFFEVAAEALSESGWLAVYGPFKVGSHFVSEGDARLDEWARATFPGAGIRDLEAVTDLAAKRGFELRDNHAMPANNRMLVWDRS